MRETDIAIYFQEGHTFKSKYNGMMKVIEYKDESHILVELVGSVTKAVVSETNLRTGVSIKTEKRSVPVLGKNEALVNSIFR